MYKDVTNQVEIANSFNNYFIDKIQPSLDVGTKSKSLIYDRTQSMFMGPSTPFDIFNIITHLKSTSNVSCDGFAIKIIKAAAPMICTYLCFIVNFCISTGKLPNALKKSFAKPLYKKIITIAIFCDMT